MTDKQIAQAYLTDVKLQSMPLDMTFLREMHSKHIAKYSFNNLAVVLGQEMPLDTTSLFQKIVTKGRGGYCFEHNKLTMQVLSELKFDVRLLLAKVIYNQDVDVPRTHRVTLLNWQGEDYIFDVGFGHLGARYPVKLELGLEQDQGDSRYRIIQNNLGEYCYQVFKDGDFFTLYTFNLHQYSEAECLPGHFFSHRHPEAAFVNNLVVCRKFYDDIKSLRNGEFYRVRNSETEITAITNVEILHELLTETFELSLDMAISEFLFSKFIDQPLSH